MQKTLPDFSFENNLWKKGINIVAGLDEVGRGALAGPVVTGCVIFKNNFVLSGHGLIINDSKKLSIKNRELTSIWIKENSLSYGIGIGSVNEINSYGIVKATNLAFRRAIKATKKEIEHLLIDAFYIPNIKSLPKSKQLPIIKGDSLSVSVAAASIIAKVHRDELMTNLASINEYKSYNWHQNKGYGTLNHRNTIKKLGKTRLHRVSFLLKLS